MRVIQLPAANSASRSRRNSGQSEASFASQRGAFMALVCPPKPGGDLAGPAEVLYECG